MKTHQDNLLEKNRDFYEEIWSSAWLLEAHKYNTWPLVEALLKTHKSPIEIAPGLRPRLPTKGTTFVDISHAAIKTVNSHGGMGTNASISALPFADDTFDLICALDIIEHVEDDQSALAELTRISTDSATLVLSAPLHPDLWTPFDDMVGHYRRYEPNRLITLLEKNEFYVEKSAVFGMKPKSSRLVDVGMWFLKHNPNRAMWWYNRVFPYVAQRQKPLELYEGIIPTDDIAELLIVCSRQKAHPTKRH